MATEAPAAPAPVKTTAEWLAEWETRDAANEKVAEDLKKAAQDDAKAKAKALGVVYPEDTPA